MKMPHVHRVETTGFAAFYGQQRELQAAVRANGLRIAGDLMRTATERRPSLWRRVWQLLSAGRP